MNNKELVSNIEHYAQMTEEFYRVLFNNDNISFDPLNLSEAFLKAFNEVWSDPKKAIDLQFDLASKYMQIWQNVSERTFDATKTPLFYDGRDRRFSSEGWSSNPIFDFIRQSYSLNNAWLMGIVGQLKTLNPEDSKKVNFYTKQFIDAVSPTNFLPTNPDALKETVDTNGENLIKGMENFIRDLSKSTGKFSITTANTDAYSVDKNLAITEGAVVYQNDLMQLIQYTPTTKQVYAKPLILMPAWINKYYILDLQPKNSMIKWLVDQGHTVFTISWVNPDSRHKDKTFESYMHEGAITAIEEVKRITNESSVNFVGYCLGGTLLACTIAYLKATYKSEKAEFPIHSATFLTSLVDFKDAGDLAVFIDEEQLKSLEKRMSEKGYLEGSDMAHTFSMLRANDMIWSFYVNNYLMGKAPFPFDILSWNADSTRLPAKMHSFYLRNMYLKNALIKPGGIKLDGTPIDLTKNDLPTYLLATIGDHIVPWKSAYSATQIYSGDVRFTLSGSGHVAGVVNHPAAKKYNYWTNEKLDKNPDNWLKNATNNEGSWWTDWNNWLNSHSGKQTEARKINPKQIIEPAPGSYVKTHIK